MSFSHHEIQQLGTSFMTRATTRMNLGNIRLSNRSRHKCYRLYKSMYMRFLKKPGLQRQDADQRLGRGLGEDNLQRGEAQGATGQ